MESHGSRSHSCLKDRGGEYGVSSRTFSQSKSRGAGRNMVTRAKRVHDLLSDDWFHNGFEAEVGSPNRSSD